MTIGLMGVGNDGMLYTPSGTRLLRVPKVLASHIQKYQNMIAVYSWRFIKPVKKRKKNL